MMLYKVIWETDGEEVDLPEIVDVPTFWEGSTDPIDDPADWLSDEFGWLVADLWPVQTSA